MSRYGDTPSWVVRQNEAIRYASVQSQNQRLEDRIKELEAENVILRKELAQLKKERATLGKP
jgi:cell division protein FtsB